MMSEARELYGQSRFFIRILCVVLLFMTSGMSTEIAIRIKRMDLNKYVVNGIKT